MAESKREGGVTCGVYGKYFAGYAPGCAARPAPTPFRLLLCAARTLNAAGDIRLSALKSSLSAAAGGKRAWNTLQTIPFSQAGLTLGSALLFLWLCVAQVIPRPPSTRHINTADFANQQRSLFLHPPQMFENFTRMHKTM